jgi:hypothetical protein
MARLHWREANWSMGQTMFPSPILLLTAGLGRSYGGTWLNRGLGINIMRSDEHELRNMFLNKPSIIR